MQNQIIKKMRNSKIVMIGAIVFSLLYIIIPIIGATSGASVNSWIGFMLLSFALGVVLWIVYGVNYYPFLKNRKMLAKLGYTDDYCLLGIEKADKMPKSKIICADNSLIFEKQKWVIPYDSVLWIYKQVVRGAYGLVTVEVNMMLFTTTGEKFKVSKVEDHELLWLLHNYGNRFSRDFILGYGSEQQKKYKEIKKREKAKQK